MMHHEVKKRLIVFSMSFLAIFVICYSQSSALFAYLAHPMQTLLGQQSMIATNIGSTFWIPLRISAMLALALSLPIGLWQLWQFIAPAMYVHERKKCLLWCSITLICFCLGLCFGYQIMLPMIFQLSQKLTPAQVTLMPDMASYFVFSTQCLFACGMMFELPLIFMMLIAFNIVNIEQIQANRRKIMLGILILSMLITPPDVFAQLLFAIPMMLLFECGLALAKNLVTNRKHIKES